MVRGGGGARQTEAGMAHVYTMCTRSRVMRLPRPVKQADCLFVQGARGMSFDKASQPARLSE